MTQDLNYALLISLIGMSLVFGAILLLWGLMALLVRLTSDPVTAPAPTDSTPQADAAPAPDADRDLRLKAAAIAVAVALAQHAASTLPAAAPPPDLSAWQAVQRARHLNRKGNRR
jgi:Na+-transporting methylmalonyl-CoA/oxaloacetate decarboxylase gamma subunit